VEGRGAATIHDVTISTIIPPPSRTTSTELKGLELKRKQTEKALERSRKAIASLETYLDSVNVEHVAVTALGEVIETYESTCKKLDDEVTELEKQLVDLNKAIEAERKKLSGSTGNNKLNLKASIGVFADHEGEVEIALIYGTRLLFSMLVLSLPLLSRQQCDVECRL
jgi:septal ring factor EnvC (AmiA/AmiB activator)